VTDCTTVKDALGRLVRGDPLPEAEVTHLAGCAACSALAEGAGAVRGGLDAWRAPPPPDDLVERTLARLAIAGASRHDPSDDARRPLVGDEPSSVDGGERRQLGSPLSVGVEPPIPLPTPAPRRRRSSVELLTSAPFDGGTVIPFPPTRRQLWTRVVTQAAAAVALFAASTAFVAAYYPAVTHAIDERRVLRCQDQLRRLAAAAVRYRREHPAGPELRGAALRGALVQGGYLDPHDLECPGPRGRDLREASYMGVLPASPAATPGAVSPDVPLFWDLFGNHADGFDVVHADGRVRLLGAVDLDAWLPHHDE